MATAAHRLVVPVEQSAPGEAKFAVPGTAVVPSLLPDNWVPRIDLYNTSSVIRQLLEMGRLQMVQSALAGSRIGVGILQVAWWPPTDRGYRRLRALKLGHATSDMKVFHEAQKQ